MSDKSLKIYAPQTIQNSLENHQIKKVTPEKSEEMFFLTTSATSQPNPNDKPKRK